MIVDFWCNAYVPCARPEVKYRHIERHKGEYPFGVMFRGLGVTAQRYHQWKQRASKRAERDFLERKLRDRIRVVHAESYRVWSHTSNQRASGTWYNRVNEKKVRKLMKAEGLRAKAARKFKATTNFKPNMPNFCVFLSSSVYLQDVV
jgi:hypothetical protein